MPRKKIAKGSAKRQTPNSFADFIKMEKDFLSTPNKLAKQLDAAVKAIKQNEKKIKSALSKNQSSTKTLDKRAQSATGKKQIKIAAKLRSNLIKDATALNKQLNQTTKSLENFSDAQSKLAALRKHLSAFEKDWTSQAKKSAVSTKTKKSKTKKQSSKSASSEETSHYHQPYSSFETERVEAEASEEALSASQD